MKSNNLILVGGGGHCKSVIDVAEKAGYHILGIIDTPEKIGSSVLDYNVIGTDTQIEDFVQNAEFVVTLGQIKEATLRIHLHELIKNAGGNLATIISPLAHVSRYASIGEGTVVMHNSLVNANASIGRGCIINSFANIEHDVIIGNYCHISTGAIVNGNCVIKDSVFIGSNSVIVNGLTITGECIIGAGTLVRKSISRKGTYFGVPASPKKTK